MGHPATSPLFSALPGLIVPADAVAFDTPTGCTPLSTAADGSQRSASDTSGRQLMPVKALVTKSTTTSVTFTSATDRAKMRTNSAASNM